MIEEPEIVVHESAGQRKKPSTSRSNRTWWMIRQIRSLLYEQGFTITGARQRLNGEDARDDNAKSQQIIHQVRLELEEILQILKR